MIKKDLIKFIDCGLLKNEKDFTIYGQEIIDKFVFNLIESLKKEGFKHYNIDYKNEVYFGRYYKYDALYFEIFSNVNSNNNEALDIFYIFSKFLKNNLGISLFEGYKDYNNSRYYYGYYIRNLFKVKQNNKIVYLKFDLRNIFYSVYNEDDYFSSLINNYVYLIPLHQNKSGVLSYINKIKDKIGFNTIINDQNISPLEKKKDALNKRIAITIYAGPKELKRQEVVVEFNNQKETILLDNLNIEEYLFNSYKFKLNNSLKKIFLKDKEVTNLENLDKFNKINICENCIIKGYDKYMIPFNRVVKSNCCLICKKPTKNLIYIKKRV